MSLELGPPADLLSPHPETAYFWGRVAGDGVVHSDSITVRTDEEVAACRLAAIAGAERVAHRIDERPYTHDTSITELGNRYTVRVFGDVADRARSVLDLPVENGTGEYQLDHLEYDRRLLRGLLEGCGTVCFKLPDSVGISFVHADVRLLKRIGNHLDAVAVPTSTSDLSETATGDYWFSIDDEAVPAVGRLLYDGCESTGLFAPAQRRKLMRCLERAEE